MPPPLKFVILSIPGCELVIRRLTERLVGNDDPSYQAVHNAFSVYNFKHRVTVSSDAVAVEPVTISMWVTDPSAQFFATTANAVKSADAVLICLRGDCQSPNLLALEVLHRMLVPPPPIVSCVAMTTTQGYSGRVILPNWLTRMIGRSACTSVPNIGIGFSLSSTRQFRMFFTDLFDTMAELGDGSPAFDGRDSTIHSSSRLIIAKDPTTTASSASEECLDCCGFEEGCNVS